MQRLPNDKCYIGGLRIYGQRAYLSARSWCAAYSRFVYEPTSPILKYQLGRKL